jgi:hypothetical protein
MLSTAINPMLLALRTPAQWDASARRFNAPA